jgi:uncharacterized protein
MAPTEKALQTAVSPDPKHLLKLVSTRMPFGKYAGRPLVDLPEPYVVWLAQKGFPPGDLGDLLRSVYEIKVNGLEYLFAPLKRALENGR